VRRATRETETAVGFERPRLLADLVTEELRRQIVEGDIDLGDALSESRIAARLNVSRTPVREAFARLELEGLVRTEPQRGTFVFALDRDAIADISDVRVGLETIALHRAMERNPKALAKAWRGICRTMRKARAAQDTRTYLALDTRFHEALFDNAGNVFLRDAYQTISAKMAALRNRLGNHPDHMAKSFAEHLELAQCASDRDARKAHEILVAHIGRKEGSYWSDVTETQEQNVPLPARTR